MRSIQFLHDMLTNIEDLDAERYQLLSFLGKR